MRRIELALAWLGLMAAPAGALDAASLRAVLFQRDRAEALGAPLVLLCHETRCEMQGNGRRAIDEDWVWYIGDPDAAICEQVRHPRLLLESGVQSFGLRHCRIIRGRDTLRAGQEGWQLGAPAGWPCPYGTTWAEATGTLPPLKRGDAIQIAYSLLEHRGPDRPAGDWQLLPLTHPGVPTLDRSILVPFAIGVEGRVKVIGDSTRLVQHWGEINPLIELHTGNLPAGEPDPTALGAPRLLFTADSDWGSMARGLAHSYSFTIQTLQQAFEAAGDSLARRYPVTRERLAALITRIDREWSRIPRPLTTTGYYPQNPRDLLRTACADRLERALVLAAFAGAARLKVDLYLARRVSPEPFLPEFPLPQQFDGVLVQVLLAEEDRSLLLDPWEPTLETACAPLPPGTLLFDVLHAQPGFREVTDDGSLRARRFTP
jgi:hypothetical protein